MKWYSYLIIIAILWVVFSCRYTKDEWAQESEPVGVLYFDGIELRETGSPIWEQGGYMGFYGQCVIIEKDECTTFMYDPQQFSNTEKNISVKLLIITYPYAISCEQWAVKRWHYIQGDETINLLQFSIIRNAEEEFCKILSIDIYFSELEAAPYRADQYATSYHGRIDYSMEVEDSNGMIHRIDGWAKSTKDRAYYDL